VQVWSSSTGKLLFPPYKSRAPVASVAWSPDGKWLAYAGIDGTVQVSNASTGTLALTCQGRSPMVSVAWSPDSKRLASASQDGKAQVWNISLSTGAGPAKVA